ncbi:TetR/AcrR family transcriptional regulator [Streptomyces sp. MNU76]|uniref:TetR/AcrR family transcriptional regulator n=1 Tax=Streptomyces sp. MNU76 TaxID=2560026 RepID=UPI001E597C02|nr:TetR/AcrR family transcriptional regulator [Streptomyces sp. MNU76]MCC9705744.1 TetR/AcrR family transcriptional regulator [Streptomyces sp. MNU76]
MTETSAAGAPKLTGRGAARRSELFEDLVALLIAEGFAQFTLDDLAARLRCSKRTLYGLAGSKEQLVRTVVVHFFRGATARVEAALEAEPDPAGRLAAYLGAVAAELAPVSPTFFDDVAAFEPAAEVYERNTRAAAARVQQLIDEGVAAGVFREVHVPFAAEVITSVMVRIQQRQVVAATGLDDAGAYAHLADLLLRGLTRTS